MSHRYLFICLLAIPGARLADAQSFPLRQPLGIYARTTPGCTPATNQTQDQCLIAKTAALVANPAVSGIDAEIRWRDLNPAPGVYTWNDLEDVLSAVDAWNQSNPGKPRKTVQIGVNPGFSSPSWVFDNMASCDAMFGALPEANPDGTLNPSYVPYDPPRPSLVPQDCGYVTFLEAESGSTPLLPLPLPWSPYYMSAWATFVRALAQKFGNNPDVVSASIAGPTASSSEMILPNQQNDPLNFYKWNYLMALTFPPSYQNSDRAFIEAWQDAIDLFSESFSGLTLVMTTGNGIPNFLSPTAPIGMPANTTGTPYNTYSVPPGFSTACGSPDLSKIMDCAAEESVIAYFADPLVGGLNLKSIQENGFGAGSVLINPLGGGDVGQWGSGGWRRPQKTELQCCREALLLSRKCSADSSRLGESPTARPMPKRRDALCPAPRRVPIFPTSKLSTTTCRAFSTAQNWERSTGLATFTTPPSASWPARSL
jgi:hypothetical protein